MWRKPREDLGFWMGWALVLNGKTRDDVSAKYWLTNTEHGPVWKLSNDEWKESIPWVLDIEIWDWKRYLVQVSEPVQWQRLLETVYDNWQIFYWDNDLEEIEKAREQVIRSKEWIDYETLESDLTHQIHEQLREILKAQIEKSLK